MRQENQISYFLFNTSHLSIERGCFPLFLLLLASCNMSPKAAAVSIENRPSQLCQAKTELILADKTP